MGLDGSVREILELKASFEGVLKQQPIDSSSLCEILKRIGDKTASLETVRLEALLKETRLGKSINKLRKSDGVENEAKAAAKTLICRWKEAVNKKSPTVKDAGKQIIVDPKRVAFKERLKQEKLARESRARQLQKVEQKQKSSSRKKAPKAKILEKRMPIPVKDQHGRLVFSDYPEFGPNLTPKEVLQRGSFGGSYFRPIYSSVTEQHYKAEVHKEFPSDWFEGLNEKTHVVSSTYRLSSNKYGVKCGGSLDDWEGSGWISSIDPFGWFQWYCRFYLGRRSSDDARQIARGRGVMSNKGRFRNQLIGRCARGGKRFDDKSVSPVIRQALQHWGYVLTKQDSDEYVELKGLPSVNDK